MTRFLGLALAMLLAAAVQTTANAQATRTWVSGVGDDANPCSRTAPCKTFAGAISKTATGGEINALDPGGFGAVTITKSITILADGAVGGILAAGTFGVTISSSIPVGSRVTLKGLDIDGVGTGTIGVRVLGAANVFIEDCTIRNFTQAGVAVQGPVGARAFLNRTTVTEANVGLNVAGVSGAANVGFLTSSVLDRNVNGAVSVAQGGAVVLNSSVLSGSSSNDLTLTGNALAISYGNNVIRNGSPNQTIGLK